MDQFIDAVIGDYRFLKQIGTGSLAKYAYNLSSVYIV
jgi:hypothetical protein